MPAHPFDDQAAFEFSDGADDHDKSAAQRPAGVDLLAEAGELHSDPIEFVEHIQKVLHRTGDAITLPSHHYIEAAAAGIGHHLVKRRPLGLRTTDPVCELGDDLIAAPSGHPRRSGNWVSGF